MSIRINGTKFIDNGVGVAIETKDGKTPDVAIIASEFINNGTGVLAGSQETIAATANAAITTKLIEAIQKIGVSKADLNELDIAIKQSSEQDLTKSVENTSIFKKLLPYGISALQIAANFAQISSVVHF